MKVTVGLIQFTSVLEPEKNLAKIDQFLSVAKAQGVSYVFLPETFYSMTDNTSVTPYLVRGEDEHFKAISNLAKKYGIYLLGGSAATDLNGKVVNRNYNFGPDGKLLGFYDKMHLFSCDLNTKGEKKSVNEADHYTPGKDLLIIEAGPLKIGASICFDLRFPEMYRYYSKNGANLLSISSAFTVPTGRAHWHILVRARAIENQSFVVATGQWGEHNDKVKTFGHSLIVSPWGEVLVDAGEGEKFVACQLDLCQIESVRKSIKVF